MTKHNKKKIPDLNIPQKKHSSLSNKLLVDSSSGSTSPILNFKFLYNCNIGDFQELHKLEKKDHQKYFKKLQTFIYNFDNEANISTAITNYTSPKGSKINKKDNEYAKRVIDCFKKENPKEAGLVGDDLYHIHLERNGKGSFVLFGVCYEQTFYVLAMNPKHEF